MRSEKKGRAEEDKRLCFYQYRRRERGRVRDERRAHSWHMPPSETRANGKSVSLPSLFMMTSARPFEFF